MRTLLKFYKALISPVFKYLFGGGCIYAARGEMSCSEYFVYAMEKYGIFRGGLKAIKRMLKCNPWSQDK